MHLDIFLKAAKMTQSEFGGKLTPAASQTLISQWVRGITRVTLDYALQIAPLTANLVTPQDCADMFIEPENRKPHGDAKAEAPCPTKS